MEDLAAQKKKKQLGCEKINISSCKSLGQADTDNRQTIESVADTVILLKEHTSKSKSDIENKFAMNKQQVFQQYINFLDKLLKNIQ